MKTFPNILEAAPSHPPGASKGDVQQSPAVRFGDVVFSARQRTVWICGESHTLEPRISALLRVLVSRHGEILSREDLIGEVWGTYGSDEALTQAISKLRRMIGEPGAIETLPRRGYRFAAEVEPASLGDMPPAATPGSATHPARPLAWRPNWAGFGLGMVTGALVTLIFALFVVNRQVEIEVEQVVDRTLGATAISMEPGA